MTTTANSSKKVLVVCQHYWPETFRVTDLCEGFVENGYDVDVLCGTPNYPAGKFFDGYGFFKKKRETHNGVNIIRVPEIPRGNNSNIRILINYLSFPFFALFYVPWLMSKKYDRVFVYQLSPVAMALPAVLLAKLTRTKLYMYICDFWPHSFFSVVNVKNNFLRSLIRKSSYWYYRQADGLMGVFKGIQTRLVSEVGIDKQKTLYIPQSAEKIYEKDMPDKEIANRFKSGFNIVFAGSINPAQSFETVTEAASIVKKAGYKNINYIIIGDGMSKKWLISDVKKRGLEKSFIFEGFKPYQEVPKYQTIADALLVALTRSPLFEYGIPAKVNSYLASGKPIIGAIDGEGQRLINDYAKAGICVDSGDAKGLAEAIMKMHDLSKKERTDMGKRGRKYHFAHLERDHNLNRVMEFVFNDNRIPDKEYDD